MTPTQALSPLRPIASHRRLWPRCGYAGGRPPNLLKTRTPKPLIPIAKNHANMRQIPMFCAANAVILLFKYIIFFQLFKQKHLTRSGGIDYNLHMVNEEMTNKNKVLVVNLSRFIMFLTIKYKGAFIHIRTDENGQEIKWHFAGFRTQKAKTLIGAKRAITQYLA